MGIQFSDWVENIVGKEEIAHYEQFLLFSQCFQKLPVVDALKWVSMEQRVKHWKVLWYLPVPVRGQPGTTTLCSNTYRAVLVTLPLLSPIPSFPFIIADFTAVEMTSFHSFVIHLCSIAKQQSFSTFRKFLIIKDKTWKFRIRAPHGMANISLFVIFSEKSMSKR